MTIAALVTLFCLKKPVMSSELVAVEKISCSQWRATRDEALKLGSRNGALVFKGSSSATSIATVEQTSQPKDNRRKWFSCHY